MASNTHELVWAAVLLDACPNVEALSVDVRSGLWFQDGHAVPVIRVDVHAGSQADAAELAGALHLREVEGRVTESDYGCSVWRTWSGWAADGSREAAVVVSVTGADTMPIEWAPGDAADGLAGSVVA